MATLILLDTHVLVWLYEDADKLVPAAVRQRIDTTKPALCPFVRLELQYLHEVGKITVPADAIIDELAPRMEMAETDPPAAAVCAAALHLSWTRDPFDRLISAQALVANTPLLTKDRTIRQNLTLAEWPT